MQYLLIMAHDDSFRSDPQLVNSIFEWIDEQTEAGVRIMGAPLMPPDNAKTISTLNGSLVVSNAPFTTGTLHTAAFEFIQCEDIKSAVAIASSHPMAERATIEVRPVWADLQQE